MSQTLTIELPDEVYDKLAAEARLFARPIAEMAAWHLVEAMTVKPVRTFGPGPANGESLKPGESLMQWAGSCDSGLTDVSSNIHEYLGQAYLDDHADSRDE